MGRCIYAYIVCVCVAKTRKPLAFRWVLSFDLVCCLKCSKNNERKRETAAPHQRNNAMIKTAATNIWSSREVRSDSMKWILLPFMMISVSFPCVEQLWLRESILCNNSNNNNSNNEEGIEHTHTQFQWKCSFAWFKRAYMTRLWPAQGKKINLIHLSFVWIAFKRLMFAMGFFSAVWFRFSLQATDIIIMCAHVVCIETQTKTAHSTQMVCYN